MCWSVGLLVCWSVGLLVCWSVCLLVCWFVGLFVCWSVGLLVCWSDACHSKGQPLLACRLWVEVKDEHWESYMPQV